MKVTPLAGGALALSLIVTLPAGATTRRDDPVDVEIAGLGITLHEQSGDAKRVTAFATKDWTYLRDKDADTFAKRKGFYELVPAPKGGRVAGYPSTYAGNRDSIIVIGPAARQSVRIKTVKSPLVANSIFWARNGRKIVLTIQQKISKKWVTKGFTTIDTASGKAANTVVPGVYKDAVFAWSPDGRYLVGDSKQGVRFYRPDGKLQRTLKGVGYTIGGEDAFSPSGKLLGTWCPRKYKEDVCVWDASSGKLSKRVDTGLTESWGWWDETHLLGVVKRSGAYQVVAVDLKGEVSQVVADITAAAWKKRPYLVYTTG